jgi:hypothetical protein
MREFRPVFALFAGAAPGIWFAPAPGMGVVWRKRLPRSQTRGIAALALFVAVEIADACSTAAGVSQFGAGIEGNPLLLFFMSTYGLTASLVGWKAIAIAAGGLLHLQSRYLALAALTVAHVFAAILPWAWLLAQ